MILKSGDMVRVRFGQSIPMKYKYGTFSHSEQGKGLWFWGYFTHFNSGKLLKRPLKEIELVVSK